MSEEKLKDGDTIRFLQDMRLYLDYSYRDFEEGDEHELSHVSIDEDGRINLFIRYGEESWFTPADWYDSWDEAFEYFELVESETA